ncbi:hypothetical protein AVEN_126370-1 [Araneus ventricosus]|uniref:Uncharacterized protein n=1 Tax=Araneus ventricosus TaxID=182803 RepID=A0A4Y2FUX3_ARAVE|nr:hypothetical protein AVEN_126370-1 [Araneus ventricosus]
MVSCKQRYRRVISRFLFHFKTGSEYQKNFLQMISNVSSVLILTGWIQRFQNITFGWGFGLINLFTEILYDIKVPRPIDTGPVLRWRLVATSAFASRLILHASTPALIHFHQVDSGFRFIYLNVKSASIFTK